MRDLIVLCADSMWKATLEAILSRPESLGLPRKLDADVRHIPGETDGGARFRGTKVLRYERRQFAYALLVFDHDGCGDPRPAEQIRQQLDGELHQDWSGAAKCIVVEPELETWIIGAHKHFSLVRGLESASAREWLAAHAHWPIGADKPSDPKRSLLAFFSAYSAKLSSANYRRIMTRASLSPERCSCPSYRLFCEALRHWFGSVVASSH